VIIETSDNRFYRVTACADEAMAHLWHGQELKRTKAGFVEKTTKAGKPVFTYVRRAATRVVEA
jgi:hypothetical protein